MSIYQAILSHSSGFHGGKTSNVENIEFKQKILAPDYKIDNSSYFNEDSILSLPFSKTMRTDFFKLKENTPFKIGVTIPNRAIYLIKLDTEKKSLIEQFANSKKDLDILVNEICKFIPKELQDKQKNLNTILVNIKKQLSEY